VTRRGMFRGIAAVLLAALLVPASMSAQSSVWARSRLDPAMVVKDLPASASDRVIAARAELAVAAGKIALSVRPDGITRVEPGCEQVFDVDFACDGGRTVGGSPATAPSGINAIAVGIDADTGVSTTATVRIVARLLGDGRVEFGLQQRWGDADAWSDRLLPARRLVPVDADVGRWLGSSPLTLQGTGGEMMSGIADGEIVVRIRARLLGDGRVEFGLQQRWDDAGAWSEPLYPARRFFPTGADVGRWLVSSPLTLQGTGEDMTSERGDERGEWVGLPCPPEEWDWVGGCLPPGPAPGPEPREPAPAPEPWRGRLVVDAAAPSGVVSVATGLGLTCGVRRDGTVACWGRNGLVNQLGASRLRDVMALSISRTDGIGVGPWAAPYVCALHGDGGVSCWGWAHEGRIGELGESRRSLPARVPGIGDATAVAAGQSHACAVHTDGTVSCWGTYAAGVAAGLEHDVRLPRRVPGLGNVASVAASATGVCGVHRDGTVSCWGNWVSGVLAPSVQLDGTPARLGGLRDVASLSLAVGSPYGGDRDVESCAVHFDGTVSCWTAVADPYPVRGLADVAAVSAGDGNVCALHRGGGVSCWGSNADGELGDGSSASRSTPARVAGVGDAVAVAAGHPAARYRHSVGLGAYACAVHRGGSVSCWGSNGEGELGDGTSTSRPTPGRVSAGYRVPAALVPATETDLLRAFGDALVKRHEAASPWLRTAWEYARDGVWKPEGWFGGFVTAACDLEGTRVVCRTSDLTLSDLSESTLVHELAHVFDLTTGLAPDPRAWGAAQLWFAATYAGCLHLDELMADTIVHTVMPRAWLTYYESYHDGFGPDSCPDLPPRPSTEAVEIVLAGLSGRVPQWYVENITNGAELWAAIRRGNATVLLANLADEFGGLCSTHWLRELVTTGDLDSGQIPPAGTNPFRDGVCGR